MSVIGNFFLWAGVFFMAVTAVGLLRLPDFYSRLHAVSKSETLGLVLVMLGLGFHEGISLVSVKLLLAAAFIFLAGPSSAHLLARAAARLGLQPWVRGPS
jgi:multicomponent Na+:H+ antiporter subunit G